MSAAEETDARAERAHRRRPAAITAAGAGLWLVASAVLNAGFTFVTALGASGLYDLQHGPWANIAQEIAFAALPFAVVFFVSVWVLRPITSAQTLGAVVGRSILATGLGVAAQFVIRAVTDAIWRSSIDRSLFGNSFPMTSFDDLSLTSLLWSFQHSLSTFLALLPLGILAGVLLWLWLRHLPATRGAAGEGSV